MLDTGSQKCLSMNRREVLSILACCSLGLGSVSSPVRASGDFPHSNWIGYRGGPTHAGSPKISGPSQLNDEKWSMGNSTQQSPTPVLSEGIVYLALKSALSAVDLVEGTSIWTTPLPNQVTLSPTVGTDNVFVTTEDGYLIAIDRESGKQKWKKGISGKPGAPTIADGVVYAANAAGRIFAFQSTTGDLVWRQQLSSSWYEPPEPVGRPTPAVADGKVFVNSYQKVDALRASDGQQIWEYAPEGVGNHPIYAPSVSGSNLCVTFFNEHGVKILSTSTGSVKHDMDLPHSNRLVIRRPAAISEDYVAVVFRDFVGGSPKCILFNVNGERKWAYTAQDDFYRVGGITLTPDHVYFTYNGVGDTGTVLTGLSTESGLKQFVQEFPQQGVPVGPIPVENGLILPAAGVVHLLSNGDMARKVGSTAEERTASQEDNSESGSRSSDPSSTSGTQESRNTPSVSSSSDTSRGFFTNGQNSIFGSISGSVSVTVASLIVTIVSMVLSLFQMARGR